MNDTAAVNAPLADAAPEVEIAHVIVHDLVKAKNGPATVDLRDDELDITP